MITNLNTVLATVDEKGAQFNASVDQLQKLITGLAEGRDPADDQAGVAGEQDVGGESEPFHHARAEALDVDALLAAMKKVLPLYMVPQDVLVRTELPRSPNGKIDRNRLRSELDE